MGRAEDEADDHWSEHGGKSVQDVWNEEHDFEPEELGEEDPPPLQPGGCPAHPGAGHFMGFGLAGGGYGDYKVCAAEGCSAVFDKTAWKDDEC